MVERSLSMREVRGSMPRSSRTYFYLDVICCFDCFKKEKYNIKKTYLSFINWYFSSLNKYCSLKWSTKFWFILFCNKSQGQSPTRRTIFTLFLLIDSINHFQIPWYVHTTKPFLYAHWLTTRFTTTVVMFTTVLPILQQHYFYYNNISRLHEHSVLAFSKCWSVLSSNYDSCHRTRGYIVK